VDADGISSVFEILSFRPQADQSSSSFNRVRQDRTSTVFPETPTAGLLLKGAQVHPQMPWALREPRSPRWNVASRRQEKVTGMRSIGNSKHQRSMQSSGVGTSAGDYHVPRWWVRRTWTHC